MVLKNDTFSLLYPIKILIAVIEMSLQLGKLKMQDECSTNTKYISKVLDNVEIQYIYSAFFI